MASQTSNEEFQDAGRMRHASSQTIRESPRRQCCNTCPGCPCHRLLPYENSPAETTTKKSLAKKLRIKELAIGAGAVAGAGGVASVASEVKKVINYLATKDDIKKLINEEQSKNYARQNGEAEDREEHKDMDEAEEEEESGHEQDSGVRVNGRLIKQEPESPERNDYYYFVK
uniref:Uncharacterized protein n=1 Tax=Romanomermis culicivorax TaxID=13658 RepID=A0A915KYL3_ROMCU